MREFNNHSLKEKLPNSFKFQVQHFEFITFEGDVIFMKKVHILLLFGCLFAHVVIAQRIQHPYYTGLTAYYTWKEEKNIIIPGTFQKDALRHIAIQTSKPENGNLTDVQSTIMECIKRSQRNSKNKGTIKKNIRVLWNETTTRNSVVAIETSNQLIFRTEAPILYFSIDSYGNQRFDSSGDSILIQGMPTAYFPKSGHFCVFTYVKNNDQISYQRVTAFSGDDVTQQLLSPTVDSAERLVVFINGYRGPTKEHDLSTNTVNRNDPTGYWFKLDNRFIDRLNSNAAFYLDAHFSVATSTHRTRINFGKSLFFTWLFQHSKSEKHRRLFNLKPNKDGFYFRMEQGKIGGEAFLTARCNGINCQNTKDTIDIVCHSMGYAYMLGFLETIQQEVVLGNCYILAPENAETAAFNWKEFQEVWQYGSDLDQTYPSPVGVQDGVAPQKAVKGLNELNDGINHRILFPKDWPNQSFINSHMIYSYDWIFDRIKPGEPGYIQP